ncbi:MAG: N-succinylarginine dihydrolase [Deltaproteobacteria bacterium]|nr:N-succinylarginine dihydrolase [Deltaproteobacteria bacterium]
MTPGVFEVNFDGIVGPTHNYAGLSHGNLASERHKWNVSNPREAFTQGLRKMKLLADMGLKQAVLPPHERPDIETLRRLGFHGTEADMIAEAKRKDPVLLASCYSASSMWTANAATVSPSSDTSDGRVHFTPANLVTQFHRSLETDATALVLRKIFFDNAVFEHHPPLPATLHFSDEGAANHTRLCDALHHPGIEIFVYGKEAFDPTLQGPAIYPARQTYEASLAISRLHLLDPNAVFFLRQGPALIDAGVFHNDVIAVGHRDTLVYHESAFCRGRNTLEQIRSVFNKRYGQDLHCIEVPLSALSVEEAVQTYLFNSQLVTLPNGFLCLIAPVECRENPKTEAILKEVVRSENPIESIRYVNLRQSMRNGGGPACLRLRVPLTLDETTRVHQAVFLTDVLYKTLEVWGQTYYRDTLHADDLSDPKLAEESRAALDALTEILKLGSIYRFQRAGA